MSHNFVLLTCHRMGLYGLSALLKAGYEPKAIITCGDDQIKHRKGNLKNVNYIDWHEIAQIHNIDCVEANNRGELKDALERLQPDLMIALGWFTILPREIFDFPTYGTVLLHPSLLPEYRGGAPMTWQILEGKKRTGITLFYLSEGIDDGDIVGQIEDEIGWRDNIKTLADRLYQKGGGLLVDHIEELLKGTAPRTSQDESKASYRRIRHPEDGYFESTEMTMEEVDRFVRAQTKPYPGAYTDWAHLGLTTIWSVHPVLGPNYSELVLVCKDGDLFAYDCEKRTDCR